MLNFDGNLDVDTNADVTCEQSITLVLSLGAQCERTPRPNTTPVLHMIHIVLLRLVDDSRFEHLFLLRLPCRLVREMIYCN